MAHLNLPVLLVARTSLGTINHTLLSIAALRAARLDLRGVVMVGKRESGKSRGDRTLRQNRSCWCGSLARKNKSCRAHSGVPQEFRSQGVSRMSSSLRVWHPFTQEALDPAPLRITRAQGVYIYIGDGRTLHRRNFFVVGESPRALPSRDDGGDRGANGEDGPRVARRVHARRRRGTFACACAKCCRASWSTSFFPMTVQPRLKSR